MSLATKFKLILIPVLALGFYVLGTLTDTTCNASPAASPTPANGRAS
jgi:hypothetical protein